ncbi:MAG: rod shape-determining protein RodA [Candidatus Omnitrophica bacterium]|nr:rod shape-determining protein RodA [Candidatus Omnitrophota bacterium]
MIGKIKFNSQTVIILCLIFLNILSIVSLYSGLHRAGEFAGRAVLTKQIAWIIISWLFFIGFCFVNYRVYFDFGFIFYGLNIVLLVAVMFFGVKVMGAQRWLSFGAMNLQPSEISKVTAIFVLARCFSAAKGRNLFKDFFFPLGLMLFNALLIFKQPDLGTGLTLLMLFILIGLSSKVKKKYFIFLMVIGLVTAPLGFSALKTYQKNRLVVFINPNVDPLGAGYTIIQSKVAIGSGKFLGKGFLSGTQNQFNFLPERHTDFIFTIVAEEWGFLGSIFLLLIYWLIITRILEKAKECKDTFAQLLIAGIAALFFIHVFINIGMTLGILPVVGIPLVFMSYGGTSMLVCFSLLGIFFNICKEQG